jgi:biopolymer transport protein ExbD
VAMGGPGSDDLLGEPGAESGGIFADINITPLTDIFLVLLIIFMVTTTAIHEARDENAGFEVNLPRAGARVAPAAAPAQLAVAVLQDGRVVVGGEVVDEPTLRRALDEAHGKSAQTLVLVQADEGVAHGRVVRVMDLARRAGLDRLAIATRVETR